MMNVLNARMEVARRKAQVITIVTYAQNVMVIPGSAKTRTMKSHAQMEDKTVSVARIQSHVLLTVMATRSYP
jgi:hypothetical protein